MCLCVCVCVRARATESACVRAAACVPPWPPPTVRAAERAMRAPCRVSAGVCRDSVRAACVCVCARARECAQCMSVSVYVSVYAFERRRKLTHKSRLLSKNTKHLRVLAPG